MTINLISTNSRKNSINKNIGTTIEVTGKLRDETDIIHPVIQFERPISELVLFNYAQIPSFGNRYYFIDNIRSITNNITEVSMTVDVLMSHPALKDCKGIIGRCTTNVSGYLDDPKMVTNISSNVTTQIFTDNAMTDEQYILIIAGFKNTTNP